MFDRYLREDTWALFTYRPKVMLATALLKQPARHLVWTDQPSLTDLALNELLCLLCLSIYKLFAYLPVRVANGFAIGTEVVYLEEDEAPVLVLQEVADKHVERALVPRVDVHLGEYFVDRVDDLDCVWVAIGHALDANGVRGAILASILVRLHREQVLHLVLRETVMKLG